MTSRRLSEKNREWREVKSFESEHRDKSVEAPKGSKTTPPCGGQNNKPPQNIWVLIPRTCENVTFMVRIKDIDGIKIASQLTLR